MSVILIDDDTFKIYQSLNWVDGDGHGDGISTNLIQSGSLENIFPSISNETRKRGGIDYRKIFIQNQTIYPFDLVAWLISNTPAMNDSIEIVGAGSKSLCGSYVELSGSVIINGVMILSEFDTDFTKEVGIGEKVFNSYYDTAYFAAEVKEVYPTYILLTQTYAGTQGMCKIAVAPAKMARFSSPITLQTGVNLGTILPLGSSRDYSGLWLKRTILSGGSYYMGNSFILGFDELVPSSSSLSSSSSSRSSSSISSSSSSSHSSSSRSSSSSSRSSSSSSSSTLPITGYLLSSDGSLSGKIYKHQNFSSVILDSFSGIGGNPIAWDSNNLLSGASDARIIKYVGFSGVFDSQFWIPGLASCGLAWDGTNVLDADTNYSNKIFKFVGFSDTISNSFNSPGTVGYVNGIGWDGINVLVSNLGSDKIYKQNGFSASILDSFSSPSNNPVGITWDGTNLISMDSTTNKIYKHNGFSSTITDSFSSPSSIPMGLTWMGL
jgi:hypothetical protein